MHPLKRNWGRKLEETKFISLSMRTWRYLKILKAKRESRENHDDFNLNIQCV